MYVGDGADGGRKPSGSGCMVLVVRKQHTAHGGEEQPRWWSRRGLATYREVALSVLTEELGVDVHVFVVLKLRTWGW